MQPNYPQQGPQGYGAPQQQPGYGAVEKAKANAGAAALAGILGLLAAGALVWTVVEYFVSADIGIDEWPTEVLVIVIVRAALALLLLIVASLTLARKIGAAWTLVILGLVTAATIVLEPIVLGRFDGWFDRLFAFEDTGSIGIVVAAGLGLLAAIIALFAGSMKSQPESEYQNGF